MQQRRYIPQRLFSLADLLVVLGVGAAIYGVFAISQEWRAEFRPVTFIDLSIGALPRYTLLSAARGFVAYGISLVFTLVVGYLAARSKTAEKIIIPMLDIGQSIPALGFMPGLILGLIALFPNSNVGLELTAVIMIFTSQVWNMAFSFYNSLKSIPAELMDASTMMNLTPRERIKKVELPFAAVDLAWNSVVSMAGGWFYLGVCEAFTMGERDYRLPGVGSYMAVATEQGNVTAMVSGIGAMMLLILAMDFLLWRPILSWVRRFRLEDVPGVAPSEPLLQVVVRDSMIVRWVRVLYRQEILRRWTRLRSDLVKGVLQGVEDEDESDSRPISLRQLHPIALTRRVRRGLSSPRFVRVARWLALAAVVVVIGQGVGHLGVVLFRVGWPTWVVLLRDTLWTLLRVMASLLIATAWTVPLGVWIGTSERRIRIAQPLIQILASFPAPMLYPLAVAFFFKAGFNFDSISVVLMLLGVQWYVLFNVLAGALKIPQELGYSLKLMQSSRLTRWKTLYLPSIFPNLITGWVIGAGGAWNASIVAEYLLFEGKVLRSNGLGATITAAAAAGDFTVLAASLTLMVAVVLIFNRAVWGPAYHLAQTRFKMES